VLAKIVGSVDILPFSAVQIGRRNRGIKTPALLIVRKDPSESGELSIDGLVASASWIKVSSRKVTEAEPAVEGLPNALPGDIVLSVLAKGAPIGTSIESLSFQTGLTREPKVTIPVTVTVPPLITLNPSDLILNPAPDAGAVARGEVIAALREDLDPKTVSVSSDSKAFAVRLAPPGESAFRIIVDWNGKEPPTAATIHVRVGSETVNLPVHVNLARVAAAP
jgi:hypothetical protein